MLPPVIRTALGAVESGRFPGSSRVSSICVCAVGAEVVETRRLELLTPSLQRRCSTS